MTPQDRLSLAKEMSDAIRLNPMYRPSERDLMRAHLDATIAVGELLMLAFTRKPPMPQATGANETATPAVRRAASETLEALDRQAGGKPKKPRAAD